MFDKTIAPCRLSPAAWELGFHEHHIATLLNDMGCDEPDYDRLYEERASIIDSIGDFSPGELRAYIDGMHYHMAEYFN